MSIDLSGKDATLSSSIISIPISEDHPLLRLGNLLPWDLLMSLVVEDLKKTTAKRCWLMGRKISVRIHLGAYLLQKQYNLTDREVEYGIKDNAAYQLFVGRNIVDGWQY